MLDHRSKERGSAEGLLESGYVHGAVTGFLGLFFTALLQARGYVPAGIVVLAVGLVAGFALGVGVARGLLHVGGSFASSLYAPSGGTTPYTQSFSHIDTLVIRGDLDGAAAAWAAVIAEQPESAFVLMKAADFHLRARKDAAVALEHFLRARSLNTGSHDLRRYVQQQIIDIHLGPLADEGRGMVELRRLIDAFPGTREAEAARGALAALKNENSGAKNDRAALPPAE